MSYSPHPEPDCQLRYWDDSLPMSIGLNEYPDPAQVLSLADVLYTIRIVPPTLHRVDANPAGMAFLPKPQHSKSSSPLYPACGQDYTDNELQASQEVMPFDQDTNAYTSEEITEVVYSSPPDPYVSQPDSWLYAASNNRHGSTHTRPNSSVYSNECASALSEPMDSKPSEPDTEETIPDSSISLLYYYSFECEKRGDWIDFWLSGLAGHSFTIAGYYNKKLKLNFAALISLKATLSDQDVDRILGDRSLPLDPESWERFWSASSSSDTFVVTDVTISVKAMDPHLCPCMFILSINDYHFVSNILIYRTGKKEGYQDLGSMLSNRFKERDPWFSSSSS